MSYGSDTLFSSSKSSSGNDAIIASNFRKSLGHQSSISLSPSQSQQSLQDDVGEPMSSDSFEDIVANLESQEFVLESQDDFEMDTEAFERWKQRRKEIEMENEADEQSQIFIRDTEQKKLKFIVILSN